MRGPWRVPSSAALAACFLFSGVGSLMMEVVWSRLLRLVFGSTTLAISTVLVAYMLGLGLGGLLGGRLVARRADGVRLYGWMEIGIGLYALAVPLLTALLAGLNHGALAPLAAGPAALARFVLVLAVLLLPTTLMGATLPILVAARVGETGGAGRGAGLLYGLNTMGAVLGVLLATFVMLPAVGVRGTNAAGALLDVGVGLLALALLTRSSATPAAPPAAAPAHRPGVPAPAPLDRPLTGRWSPPLLAYAVVGFTALVCEVAWTRALSMILGSSIYAFATMLAAFLTGIGLGSLLARRAADRVRRPVLAFIVGLAALALTSLGTTLLLPHLPDLFLRLVGGAGPGPVRLVAIHLTVSGLAMLPPTLILGALFPLLSRLLAGRQGGAGAAVGDIYFVNTLGSASGAFAAGFLLLPRFGIATTLLFATGLNLCVASVLLLWYQRTARPLARLAALAPAAAALALLLSPPDWNREALTRGVFREPTAAGSAGIRLAPIEGQPEDKLLFYEDGLNTTVSVHRGRGMVTLRVNGKPDASSLADMPTQVLSGALPVLFGPPARDVLVIGHASGVTAGSIARVDVRRLDAVEIEPAIIRAARFFDEQSGRPLDDPRVRLILEDGRTWLARPGTAYDVIISEPSNPWITGVSNLFTREFFATARRALRPGGSLVQWVQLYGMDEPALQALLAAVRSEFPYVYGCAHTQGRGDLILLARSQPLGRADLPRWERVPRALREALQGVGVFSTADLWSLVRLTPSDIESLIGADAVVNSDDNLFVELRAPWTLYRPTVRQNWDSFQRFAGGVLPLLESVGEPADGELVGDLALSYLEYREDPFVAAQLSRIALGRGPSAGALAVQVSAALDLGRIGPQQAALLLDQALESRPDALHVRLQRCQTRLAAGRPQDALADAEEATRQAPDDPRARALLALSLGALGRNVEAMAAVDALRPTSFFALRPALHLETARIAWEAGRLDEAERDLGRFLEATPESPAEWRFMADLRRRRGDEEAAARAERNADTAARNEVLLLHQRARRALADGVEDEAVRLLEQTLRLDPDYGPARDELGRLRGPAHRAP